MLLILAGISISMISSQDGILNKTTKAKKEMNKSQLEEIVELAITEWKIEKESNKNYNVTLKEYLDSKKEITSAEINEPLTIVSGDNVVTINGEKNISVNSKSKNLIKNGYLENKNNNNFSEFNYHKDGYLYMLSNNIESYKTYISDEYIPVDTSKKYKESVVAKTDNVNVGQWLGLIEYDIDYNVINTGNFMYEANSLTYLTQDLKNGDTVIYLNDVSGFNISPEEKLKQYQNGIIVWNYVDNKGNKYAPLTYSRNVYKDLFDYDQINKENNTITLKKAWSGENIEAGTYLSQKSAGASYHYLISDKIQKEWKTYSNTIQGEIEEGKYTICKFRPGTKYVKFVYLAKNEKDITTTYFKDIVFEEVEE